MANRPDLAPTAVAISLGGGVSFSVTTDDVLIVEDDFVRMSLGRATNRNFDSLIENLGRLRIHAVD